MNGKISRVIVVCWMAGATLLSSVRSEASNYVFEFRSAFGSPNAARPVPWIDAIFQDVAPATVRLTITNVGLIGGEFASGLYFNFNPSLDPEQLVFSVVASSGTFALPRIDHLSADSYKAGGGGNYDIRLVFSTVRGHRFSAGKSLTFQITGIDTGLTAGDFNYSSTGGSGAFYAAAHVQGISGGSKSEWIRAVGGGTAPVPEPRSGALLVLMSGLWGGARWLRKRRYQYSTSTQKDL